MDAPTTDPAATLEPALRQRFPDATLDVTRFPSGVVFVDVRLGTRFFVVAWFPREAVFGVDELRGSDDEGLDTHYRHGADDVPGVLARLEALMAHAPGEVAA